MGTTDSMKIAEVCLIHFLTQKEILDLTTLLYTFFHRSKSRGHIFSKSKSTEYNKVFTQTVHLGVHFNSHIDNFFIRQHALLKNFLS